MRSTFGNLAGLYAYIILIDSAMIHGYYLLNQMESNEAN